MSRAIVDRRPCVGPRHQAWRGLAPACLISLVALIVPGLALAAPSRQTNVTAPSRQTNVTAPSRQTNVTAPNSPGPVAASPVAFSVSAHDQALADAAFAAAQHGQWDKARALAADATDKMLPKILQWLDLKRPGAGHSFDEIAAFVDANPDWPNQAVLRSRAEDSLSLVPDAQASAWFAAHRPVTPFAQLRAAELLPDHDAAQQQIRAIWINADFSAGDERLVLAKYGTLIRPEDHSKRLDRLIWANKIDAAQRMVPYVPVDQVILAEARVMLALPGASAKQAEAALARVPAAFQNEPGLLYARFRWHRRFDQNDAALAIIQQAHIGQAKVTTDHPDLWWPERQALGRYFLQQNEPAKAYAAIDSHGLISGPDFVDAEFFAGWIALRFMKDPAKAYPHFVSLYDHAKLALSLARGAYWAGRAADAQGQTALAQGWYNKAAIYTTSYYGQLAAAMPGVAPPPKPVPEPQATPAELAAFNAKELVHATRLLKAIGQDDEIRPFVVRLTDLAHTPGEFALVADLAEEIGRADLGVSVAKQASIIGVSLFRAGYPIVPMPRNAGTEQALLLALTRQESAFEVKATSPTGARGLMQLMPGTARGVARSLDIPYSEDRLGHDPLYNATLGQAFMDGLISDFNGSYLLAIAGYNAGPGAVQKWLATYGDPRSPQIDAVDWVELIPYGETRNYVQRVLENLQVYRLRIGDKSLAFSLEADLRR